ncbi:putative aldo/keto reductase-like oxidoreductase [Bradyrhizobium sp. cir1]|nr:putative aldo/keto reductase-like oxidoreductase [Bradyrhizobium sp. cir1]
MGQSELQPGLSLGGNVKGQLRHAQGPTDPQLARQTAALACPSHAHQFVLAHQVERSFALLTDKKIRRGIYRSIRALRADIMDFITHHNADPKPFKWTKSPDDILASVERFCRYNTQA